MNRRTIDMIVFAIKHPGWQTFSAKANFSVELPQEIFDAQRLGFIEINDFNQFRLKIEQPTNYMARFLQEEIIESYVEKDGTVVRLVK